MAISCFSFILGPGRGEGSWHRLSEDILQVLHGWYKRCGSAYHYPYFHPWRGKSEVVMSA